MITTLVRTLVLFSLTIIVVRAMGKRQLAQLQPFEIVITLMIAELAALPIGTSDVSLLSGVTAILTLLLLHSLLSALSFRSIRLRAIICGRPSVLVRGGRICEDELSRLCFDLSDLMEGIRSQGLLGLHETGGVVLETNGVLSVFPSAENRPATRAEMKLAQQYDGIPLTLILDGQIQQRPLSIAGRDTQWLADILKGQGIQSEKRVLVALLNTQGVLLIQEKGERGRLLKLQVMKPDEVVW